MTGSAGWTLKLDSAVLKTLKKLDRPVASRILNALERLEQFDTPQAHCKALTGQYSGLWRYRIGDYRVILDFDGQNLVILALEVGHWSNVYGS